MVTIEKRMSFNNAIKTERHQVVKKKQNADNFFAGCRVFSLAFVNVCNFAFSKFQSGSFHQFCCFLVLRRIILFLKIENLFQEKTGKNFSFFVQSLISTKHCRSTFVDFCVSAVLHFCKLVLQPEKTECSKNLKRMISKLD